MDRRHRKIATYGQHRNARTALGRVLRALWAGSDLRARVQTHLPEPLEARQLLAANVIINEIMYHPGYGDPGTAGYIAENVQQEYIELYNQGTSSASLTNWTFNQGVTFTFPEVTIPAGGYVVVAADVAAFQAKYPGVTNVVGGWTGQLSNNGEDIELENELGQRVDLVSYSSEGEWANRRRVTDLAYPSGIKGWDWVTGADAGKKSLELINPALSNDYGQNWTASLTDWGTPGRANSTAATNIAPMILETKHYPVIPKPTDAVTVTARIVDELGTNPTVTLHWRLDGAAGFTTVSMLDDGQHGDGIAWDGLYGAIIPAQATNPYVPEQASAPVVEFYVSAADASGKTRSWPASTNDAGTEHASNALYQVDESVYNGNQPIYRFIVTQAEWAAWYAQMGAGDPEAHSDAQMNSTFISMDGTGSEVRYLVGMRNRGEGTRHRTPHNMQIKFPLDRLWHGITTMSLNTQYTWAQVAGNAVFSMAGLPAPYGKPVQVRINGTNRASSGSPQYTSYFQFETYNTDWAKSHFPEDGNGNIYKAVQYGTYPWADLRWVPDGTPGASSDWYKKNGYSKESNKSADDWTDLVNLLWALNKTSDAEYTQAVSDVVNVDEWLSYFVVNFLIGNRENSLGGTDDNTNPSIVGDDYSLYSGVADTRFQLLVHDLDTVLGQGDTGKKTDMPLFPTFKVAAIDKLLKWKDFAPRYFEIYREQMATTFSPERLNPLLDQLLGGWIPASNIQAMKDFAVERNAWVLSQIPQAISVTSPPATSATSTVSLTGLANAITTRSVRVNGVLATWSAWEAKWTAPSVSLHGGVNHIIIQSYDADGKETDHTYADVRYDKGSVTTLAGGTLAANTTLTAANSPYQLTSSLTIPSGRTLTIQPGVSVYLGNATTTVNIIVNSGGRIIAEGTNAQRIVLSGIPGASYSWGNIIINGAANSPETRIAYTHIVNNSDTAIDSVDGTILLDHLTFGTTSKQYLVVDRSSFLVQDCEFPATTASFEPVHGVGDVKAGGRGIFLRNYFGPITGYNDTIDYTGGNRPGAIVQFIDNVFAGTGDDNLDVDSTDAWVQGNIFLHIHKNGPPDTSSAVSGGEDTGYTSEVTIIGNIFYDLDQVANAKEGNFFTLINNTIVRQTHVGGLDTDGGVVVMQDNGMTEGRGMYFDGNIIYDIEKYVRDQGSAVVTLSNNILPLSWTGPGTGNLVAEPAFKHMPQMSETYFTNWTQAQLMRDWFSLVPGTAAVGTGPNGTDKGAIIPSGVSISGEPLGTTSQTSATLIVGSKFTGNSIPATASGFPNGSGYTHYKYRLDGGPWSDETPISTPISLTDLGDGQHSVEVIGKNDANLYQNDPILGSDAYISQSLTWTVDSTAGAPHIRINEVLADNIAIDHDGTFPDLVELYNDGQGTVDLSGMIISDGPLFDEAGNALFPSMYVFAAGTTLGEGEYLVLYGDTTIAPGEFHLGFALSDEGDAVYIYPAGATSGVAAVDSVAFGVQVVNLSIGVLPSGQWALTKPTFGEANVPQPLADPGKLQINEWLTDELVLFKDDFVELYNPQGMPAALGGLYLTDNPVDLPRLAEFDPALAAAYQIVPLSFIAGDAHAVFYADGNTKDNPDHTTFKLSPHYGMVGLLDGNGKLIDEVIYGNQSTDVSQGRSPDGSSSLAYYPLPHPDVQNPGITTIGEGTTTNIFNIASGTQQWYFWDKGSTPAASGGLTWKDSAYPTTGWKNGAALFWNKNVTYPETKRTEVAVISAGKPYQTYYFRTTFTYNGDASKATSLEFRTIIDDGAVFYLNGREATERFNMDAGTVTYSTVANTTVGTAAYQNFTIDLTKLPAGTLKQGQNVLAVEVHQCQNQTGSSPSTDLVFGTTLAVKESSTTTIITNPIPENVVNLMAQLRITELMYDPIGGAEYEYIELKNTGSATLDLTGVRISNGVDFVFPAMNLEAGQYVLVAADRVAFESRYGTSLNVAGQYVGRLSNGGEGVTLQLPAPYDAAMLRFDYNPAWYPVTNGGGRSLVIVDASAAQVNWSDRGSWRASVSAGGSPGAVDQGDLTGSVVVSEVLAHTDASEVGDWIELHNTTNEPIDISGWYLSDDQANLTKYQIRPNTVIPKNGYVVFNQFEQFGNAASPGVSVAFGLSEAGDAVYLTNQAEGGGPGLYRESASFGASDREVTFGRFVKSDGNADFVSMSYATPREANAYPLVGPVVISELMYHPLAGDEYVELHNITDMDAPLYDPLNPLNTWAIDGIGYSFPTGVVLPANGYLLVVQINPAVFRAKYNVPAYVQVLGAYTGALNNGGELITLRKPGHPELPPALLPYVVVDAVLYDNNAPWPTAPDGRGPSLVRVDPTHYANDVINWASASASPGAPNFEATGPTVDLVDVLPDPRTEGVDLITITFSAPVVGFDLGDLSLTRYGSANLLTAAQTLTTANGSTWTLGNLSGLTSGQGRYTLTLTALGSGITDQVGHGLAADATEGFAVTRLLLEGSSPGDSFYVRVNGTDLEVYKNGLPESSAPADVVPLADVSLLEVRRGSCTVGSDVGGLDILVRGVEAANPTTVAFDTSQHLSSLTIEGSAKATLTAGSSGKFLRTRGLSITGDGVLDLADNDLILQSTSEDRETALAEVFHWIKSGRKGSSPAIASSAAAANDKTSLATTLNDKGGTEGAIYAQFDGEDVDTAAILVKYTWNGDANLDGVVNADDYFLVDSGFLTQAAGYRNGDLNYDGVVNADDYFLIDSAFLGQTGPLASDGPANAAAEELLRPATTGQPVTKPENGVNKDLLQDKWDGLL